jgi:hypothetical protein
MESSIVQLEQKFQKGQQVDNITKLAILHLRKQKKGMSGTCSDEQKCCIPSENYSVA